MPEFETVAKGGLQRLVDAIGPEINVSGRSVLGILVDANDNPQKRWQLLQRKLKEKGIVAPAAPERNGTVVEGIPRIGIWIMPDNQSPGELEDFIERLVPSSDPVWKMASDFIDAIPDSQRKFPENKQVKAKVRAWLATRARPRNLGEAIGKGDLSVSEPIARALANWLRILFTA